MAAGAWNGRRPLEMAAGAGLCRVRAWAMMAHTGDEFDVGESIERQFRSPHHHGWPGPRQRGCCLLSPAANVRGLAGLRSPFRVTEQVRFSSPTILVVDAS